MLKTYKAVEITDEGFIEKVSAFLKGLLDVPDNYTQEKMFISDKEDFVTVIIKAVVKGVSSAVEKIVCLVILALAIGIATWVFRDNEFISGIIQKVTGM